MHKQPIVIAATHMQRVLNSTASAYGTLQLMSEPASQVAVAEEYKADAIFSFDHFYATKGFKLAEDLKK